MMRKSFILILRFFGIRPLLDSERLRYQKFTQVDYEDYYTYISNPHVMKYIGSGALQGIEAEIKFKKLLETNDRLKLYGFFRAIKKDDNQFVGLAKFDFLEKGKVEVGYALLPEYWGQGFATEMLKGMVKYARNLGSISELLGLVDPHNPISKKVLTKHQFELFERGYFNNVPTEFYKLNI